MIIDRQDCIEGNITTNSGIIINSEMRFMIRVIFREGLDYLMQTFELVKSIAENSSEEGIKKALMEILNDEEITEVILKLQDKEIYKNIYKIFLLDYKE